jgi:hypothetical protein
MFYIEIRLFGVDDESRQNFFMPVLAATIIGLSACVLEHPLWDVLSEPATI